MLESGDGGVYRCSLVTKNGANRRPLVSGSRTGSGEITGGVGTVSAEVKTARDTLRLWSVKICDFLMLKLRGNEETGANIEILIIFSQLRFQCIGKLTKIRPVL